MHAFIFNSNSNRKMEGNCVQIIEENFSVGKTIESIYAVDDKQEKKFQSEVKKENIFESVENVQNDKCERDPTSKANYETGTQKSTFKQKNLEENLLEETADIVCQCCDHIFNTMHEAECHQCKNIHALKHKIVCKTCEEVLNTKDIEKHQCPNMKKEQIACLFSCPACPKIFSKISMLQKHQNSQQHKKTRDGKANKRNENEVIADDRNHCNICNTTFSSQKNLKLHSRMHLKAQSKTIREAMPVGTEDLRHKNNFYCEICNKSFDHLLLSVHQNMHQNIEEHNCSKCNRQFENQVSYDMHMQLHADQPTRMRSQSSMKQGARFACNYCGKEFFRPHEKVKHERIHTGEKPYECEVCGKSFRVSYSLTLHLRTHTDVRPFVCAQCNKRFKSYAVYSHHLNTHSEDRPYKCPMCPKSFRTSVQLCGHKNSHTKPYNCPECNRPFSSLYAVKMHMKTHSKSNKSNENFKHRCGTCGAVYARMFALRFHMKEQHSTNLVEEEEQSTYSIENEDEVSVQAIVPEEQIIIDSFQFEEIVADW